MKLVAFEFRELFLNKIFLGLNNSMSVTKTSLVILFIVIYFFNIKL